MKINDILLKEAIETHGNDFVAYCIVVAEEFKELPKLDKDALSLWEEVALHNEKMLSKIFKQVSIEYTNKDPYKNQKDMMYDIIVNRRMRIFKTESDDDHPGLSAVENDILRAVHDFIGHHLPNEKEFAQFLSKNNFNKTPEYKDFRFSRNNFTVRGEMNTYLTHTKLLPKRLKPVFFTEIVGQICTYFVTGHYTENKVAIMQGIDFDKVGKFTSTELNNRKERYREMLDDSGIEKFHTKIGDFSKDSIRWNLLSRGEGQKRKKD